MRMHSSSSCCVVAKASVDTAAAVAAVEIPDSDCES